MAVIISIGLPIFLTCLAFLIVEGPSFFGIYDRSDYYELDGEEWIKKYDSWWLE